MPQGGEVADVSPISPFLIGFKPRQVLLAERQQQKSSKLPTLMANNEDMESVLACSVALWLENKGFSKVLKRFLPLAKIKDDDWRAKAHDLNEVFSKHLAASKDVPKDVSSQKKQELQVVGSIQINGDANGHSAEGIEIKKKKKKNKGEDAEALATKTPDEVVLGEKGAKTSGVSSDSNLKAREVDELPVDKSHKSKKDKKKKGTAIVAESIDDKNDTDKAVESKDKKKKKKLKDNKLEDDKDCELESKKEDAAASESNKASKKRKRGVDDETEIESNQEVAVQESKPKKSKGEKKGKDVQEQDKVSAAVDISSNEDANGVDNSSHPKSGRKQNGNSSAEPKSVNVFQRVKIDEVEFADERLQDNSYWAKHGAETGYGAKAQEVLGQVKGRDFRHEKTKKKRGSYRGGIIDLQSHSIKFDNSDDE